MVEELLSESATIFSLRRNMRGEFSLEFPTYINCATHTKTRYATATRRRCTGNVCIMSNERVIKKYANRRLYDSTGSRHVTLDEIRKLIAAGEKDKGAE